MLLLLLENNVKLIFFYLDNTLIFYTYIGEKYPFINY